MAGMDISAAAAAGAAAGIGIMMVAAGFAAAFFPAAFETVLQGWKRKLCGKSRRICRSLWILLLFGVFWCGFFRMGQAAEQWSRVEESCPEDGESLRLAGRVQDIRKTTWSDVIELETNEYERVLVYADLSGALPSETELRIGQWLEAEGKAGRFEPARNPGQFDFRQYYRSRKISMSLSAEQVEIEGGKTVYSPYLDGLYRFRRGCSRILEEICEPADRGIFQAAILGEKSGMDGELRDLYQRNGISHILAISGLHLSMIGMGLYRILRKTGMGYGLAGILSGAAIVSFGVMTGGSGSALRAIIMLLASFLAAYLGRTYDLLSALSLAALLLAWGNPFLITQSGFQLSFGAVLGIGLLGEAFGRILSAGKGWQKTLLVSLSIQLMTGPIVLYHYFQYPVYGIVLNLLVVPLMGYVVLSGLLGIGAGFLVPALGVAAVGSGHYILQWYQMLCRSFEHLPGAQAVFGRPRWGQIAAYYGLLAATAAGMKWIVDYGQACSGEKDGNRVENLGGNMDASGKYIGKNNKKITVSGKYSDKYDKKSKESGMNSRINRRRLIAGGDTCRKIACAVLILGSAGCLLCLGPLPQKGLDGVFLDVGQGDGIVIRCEGGAFEMWGLERLCDDKDGRNTGSAGSTGALEGDEITYKGKTCHPGRAVILVDGGSTSEKKLGEDRLEPYLKSCGIQAVDLALVSHGDMDHISGLCYLLEECSEIRIAHLVLPELGKGDDGYDRLIRSARLRGTQIWYMNAGDRIQAGRCEMVCLYPEKGEAIDTSDRNQQSLIVEVGYGQFHMLLTGDADAEGERRLAQRQGQQLAGIQVLKAAHHGSRNSNSRELLEAVRPALAVISYEKGNSYGHPHKEAVERMRQAGCRILETGESGAVFLHAEGDKVRYRTYLQEE